MTTTNPLRRDRRIKRTRKMIKDIFLSLLDEQPFEKITVASICRIADINRSTFYLHYEDIFFLLRDVQNDLLSDVDAFNNEHIHNDYTADETMRNFLNLIYSNKSLLRLCIAKGFDISFNNIFMSKCIDLYRNMLIGKSGSAITGDDTFENTLLFLTYGYFAIYKRWLESNCQENIDSIVKTAMHLSQNCFDSIKNQPS